MNPGVRYLLYCGITALISLCGAGTLYGYVDELPPLLDVQGSCGEYRVKVTELRNFGEQKDCGVLQAPWLWESESDNFYPVKVSDDFKPGEANFSFHFELRVIDPFKNAHAKFLVTDIKSNRVLDSIVYNASALNISKTGIEFGSVKLGQKNNQELVITNPFDTIQLLTEISFTSDKKYFSADETMLGLAGRETRTLTITYSPTREAANLADYDRDTLLLRLRCYTYRIPLVGLGVKPHIQVDDFDAGVAAVGTRQCLNYELQDQPRPGFRITNSGTDELIITAISLPDRPFELSDPVVPKLPITIPPESDVRVTDLCFAPNTPGEYFSMIAIQSNAADADSIVKLTGIALPPGPYMQAVNFYNRRVGSSLVKNVIVKNNGTTPAFITGFQLEDENADFKIIESGITPHWTTLEPVVLYPENSTAPNVTKEIIVPVEFKPLSEYGKETIIKPVFHPKSPQAQGSSWTRLKGYGILPKIQAKGYSFNGIATVNTTHPDTGKIVIRSVSTTADLYINKIEISSFGPANEFKFKTPPPRDITLPIGDSIVLDVEFSPAEEGDRYGRVVVYTDAANYQDMALDKSDTTVFVRGWGLNKGMAKARLQFPNAIACDSSATTLTLKNPSKTLPLKIYSIRPYSEDTSYFRINYDFSSQPVIQPSDSLEVPASFLPKGSAKTDFQAGFKIYADRDTAVCIFVGASFIPQISVKTSDVPRVVPGTPIGPFKEGENGTPFSISVASDNWSDLNAKSIKLELIYKAKAMLYAGIIESGDAIPGWNVDAKEEIFGRSDLKLTIEASGDTPISEDGVLFKPQFNTLLGDTTSFRPRIGNIELSISNDCYSVSKNEGEINIFVCGDELRSVEFGTSAYSVEKLSPNPVSADLLTIDYTIAFKERARLELLDARGALVRTILDAERPAGKNTVVVDVSRLASNIYFLRFSSGPFVKTYPILIEK